MVKTKAVPADTLAVLGDAASVRPKANVIDLRDRLPRPVYERVNKVLEGLGGKWNRKLGGHVFEHDTPESLADKFDTLLATGQFVRPADLGQFMTPDALADRVIATAALHRGMSVLEPSAGTGQLATRAAAVVGRERVVVCEQDDVFREKLSGMGFRVAGGDFLTVPATPAGAGFQRVLMNPPFARGQDVLHVARALEHLATGGRLVAILSAALTYRREDKFKAIRTTAEEYGQIEHLPPGSFRESGTDVHTVLVTIDKTW